MSTMTGQNVLDGVRARLSDTYTAPAVPKWTDAELIPFVNAVGIEIMHLHPFARLAADGSLTDWTTVTSGNLSSALALDDLYFVPMVEGVCAAAYRMDASDKQDRDRAKLHADAFDAWFRPRGG